MRITQITLICLLMSGCLFRDDERKETMIEHTRLMGQFNGYPIDVEIQRDQETDGTSSRRYSLPPSTGGGIASLLGGGLAGGGLLGGIATYMLARRRNRQDTQTPTQG